MPLHSKKAILCFVACSVFCQLQLLAQSNDHRTEPWSTDYTVNHVEYSGGYTMISGDFNQVGPYNGSGILTNAATSVVSQTFPRINEITDTSVPDGNGGWFIGGSFSLIDKTPVKNIAHIKSDNTLDTSWKPNVAGSVYCMALNGTTLYIGGTFQSVNGQTRNFIAALDATDGSLKSWNPDCNNVVRCITPNGSNVFAGGDFTAVGGQLRNHIAALDATTGAATSWDPSVTGNTVNTIAMNSTSVFIGGDFTSIGGTARSSLGAVDINTGSLLSWNANPLKVGGAKIYSLLLSATTLYTGGDFTTIDGQAISYLAAIDASAGTALSWNPQVNSTVFGLALSGSTLYAAGQFYNAGGVVRQCVAAVKTSDASALAFTVSPNGAARTISADGGNVFIGGSFSGANWTDRNNFALFDETTNAVWPYPINLSALGRINTIAVKDNVLYIGGQFTDVNGQARLNIAALDLSNGNVLSWNPSVSDPASASNISEVFTLKIKDNLLYAGGTFMEVNGQPHESLAAIDLTSGVPDAWHPVIGDGISASTVYSIDFLNDSLYVAGQYSLVNGQPRANLCALDLTSANLLSWDPQPNDQVFKIRVTSTTAYIVGNFDDIGGTTMNNSIAAIDLSSGALNNWFPAFDSGYITDVALTTNDVIVAGYFAMVGAEYQTGLASFSQATGELNNWKPDVGSTEGGPNINAVDVSSNRIFVGGSFNNTGDEYRSNYAEYDMCAAKPSITLNGSSLTSTQADSYQWFLNNEKIEGATSQSLSILLFEYGLYAVEATMNGCTGRSDDFTYLITGTENDWTASKVYPNPVAKEFYIETKADGTATIINMTGAEIFEAGVKAQEPNRIDAQHLIPGIYLLKIQTKSDTRYHKIYKK